MALELRDFGIARGTHVVAGADLRVATGEVVAVTGPSGSGKSTLLAVLAGFLRLARGTLHVDGTDSTRFGDARWTDMRRTRIAHLGHDLALIDALTAEENVAIAPLLAGLPAHVARTRARTWLAALGLEAHATQRADRLSSGQRQRVALARALAHPGAIGLVDEPTTALDEHARAAVLAALRARAAEGAAILVTTHDGVLATAATRRYGVRADGRVTEGTA